ncbi:conjugal transfer protein TraG N-terminal domain-containing protein [Shewanella baltica]|uniref:conjugal transfer protein TraG N-terminal domain-containing protein n=2 Tax=Shewanella baltica TaxID=62322 RepID=UPI0021677764|nr:conjugal transfer protein TraG N-terminal domain-containing protein [Shewanella baltica]UVW66224.1 conjugal transfer protein TraG [Shewanella baltica]
MLTIYSLGDLDLLIKMAQSAELAFSDGGIANSNLIAIGLGITLLVSAFKQIFAPDKFHVKEFFIALFTYMFLFTPKVDFYVESVRTGEVSQSFTLPFGIVAPAALATMIGGGFAQGMSEAYASITPDYDTEPGTNIDPLKALLKARFVGTSEADASYRSVGENLGAYIKNCYFEDIRNGKNPTGQAVQEVNHDESVTGAFDFTKLKVTSGSWYTPYYDVNTKSYTKITCTDAYAKLGNDLSDSSPWAEEMKGRAAIMYNMAEESQVEKVFESLTGDTANLINLYRANFVKAMMAKVGASYVELDPSERLAFQQEFDAIQQRHLSQAAQSSFFLETAPALITWFECFIFLIAPLLPVFLTFGSKGIMMAGKLYSFLLAVNFWPIIQVGVNMYTNHYFNKLMCSLPGNDSSSVQNCMIAPSMRNWSIDSLGGMDSAYTTLETFVSQAAIIQTMVPALAMMIVFGGVHTMMGATQKAQMGANMDAKGVSPQTVNSDGKTVSSGGYGVQMTSSGDWIESRQGVGNMSSVSSGGSTYNAQQAGTSALSLANSSVDTISATDTSAKQAVGAANERLMTSVGTGNSFQNGAQAGIGYEQTLGFAVSNQIGRGSEIGGSEVRQKILNTLASMTETEANQFAKSAGFGIELGHSGSSKTQSPSGINPVSTLLSTLGVNAHADATWSQTQSSIKAQLQSEGASSTSTLTASEKESVAKAYQEQNSEVNRKAHSTTKTDTSSANYQNAKARDEAVARQQSTAHQLQEAQSRSRELRDGVTSSGSAGSSANIKFGELISTYNREMFSKTDTLSQIAQNTADGIMRGKYGDDWNAATKGVNTLDFNSTMNALTAKADAAKYNAMRQDYAGNQSLYDVARDKQGLQNIVNNAQTEITASGRPVPITDVGSIADRAVGMLSNKMAGTQSDPIKSAAVQNLATGASIEYAALNGNSSINTTAMAVGDRFTQIGQAQILDYNKPVLTAEQQNFKSGTEAGIGATGQRVENEGAKVENEAAQRANDYKPDYDALQLQSPAKWTPDQQHKLDKLDKNIDDLWKKMQQSEAVSGPAGISKIIDTVAQEMKSGTYGAVSPQVIDRVAEVMKNASNSPAELGRMLNDFTDAKSNYFSGDHAAQVAPVISAMANTVDGLLGKAINSDQLSPSEKPYFQNAQQAFSGLNDAYSAKVISDRSSSAGNAAAQVISSLGSSKDPQTQQAVALASTIAAEGTSANPLPNAEFSRYYKENNPSSEDVIGMRLVTDRAQGIVTQAMGQDGLSEPVKQRLAETLQGLKNFNQKLAASINSDAHARNSTGYDHATAYDDATKNSPAMSGLSSSERIRAMDGFNRIGVGEGSTQSRMENTLFNGQGANMQLESIANKMSPEDKAAILGSLPDSVRSNVERGMELTASNSSPSSEKLPIGETQFPSSPVASAQGDTVSQHGAAPATTAQGDTVSQHGAAPAATTQGDTVSQQGAVPATMAQGDTVSQHGAAPAATTQGDAVSQHGAAPATMAQGDTVSQHGAAPATTAQGDAVSQHGAAPAATTQGDTVSQQGAAPATTAQGDTVSQHGAAPAATTQGDTVSQQGAVPATMAQGDTVSQHGAAPAATTQGDAVSQHGAAPATMAQGDTVSQHGAAPATTAQGDAVSQHGAAPAATTQGDTVSQHGAAPATTAQGDAVNTASPEGSEPEVRYVETPAENSTQSGSTVVENNPYAFDGNQAGFNFSVMGGFGKNVQPSNVSYNSVDLVGGGAASGHSVAGSNSSGGPSMDTSNSNVPTMKR